jgi:hypothetical protein
MGSFYKSIEADLDALDARMGGSFGADGARATRKSVLDAFQRVQSEFEGSAKQFDFMYTDILGLVTTGMGNLIDGNSNKTPMADMNAYGPALRLPWVHKSDGQPATQAEIIQDWQTVKNAHTQTGTYDAGKDSKMTQLRLPQDALQNLIADQVTSNEKALLQSFPGFAGFPADGQMVIHGMGWAMGSGFVPAYGFKAFADAVNRGDWVAAKANSAFKLESPQRKTAHDKMFDNAAKVVAQKLDPETLWYPMAPGDIMAKVVRYPIRAAAFVLALVGIIATGVIYATGGRVALPALPARTPRRRPA